MALRLVEAAIRAVLQSARLALDLSRRGINEPEDSLLKALIADVYIRCALVAVAHVAFLADAVHKLVARNAALANHCPELDAPILVAQLCCAIVCFVELLEGLDCLAVRGVAGQREIFERIVFP